MDVLKSMKESLMCAAQTQMSHLDSVDAKELGEVIDMIKDLEEAIYYCTITEAMHQKEKEGNGGNQHTTIYYSEPMRDNYSRMYYDGGTSYRMYNDGGRMYAGNNNGGSSSRMYADGGRADNNGNEGRDGYSGNGGDGHRNYSEGRDPREGMSPQQRRMYMESKEMHQGKAKQLQELEKYMKELSTDLVGMIEDASAEEKQYLGNRLSTLATKIAKMEG